MISSLALFNLRLPKLLNEDVDLEREVLVFIQQILLENVLEIFCSWAPEEIIFNLNSVVREIKLKRKTM